MNKENFVTCRCQYCDKGIEFDANELEITGSASGQATGQTIPCPHCGMETLLFIPNTQKTSEKIAEKVPEKTAKIVKQIRYSGGMEDTLEEVGGVFLFLGILGGIGAVIGAVVAFNDDQAGMGVDLLCVGAALIFASAVNRILFRAAAEAIRLLKKLNSLKFSGKVSEPETLNDYTCSSCGASVYRDSEKCYSCDAKFKK